MTYNVKIGFNDFYQYVVRCHICGLKIPINEKRFFIITGGRAKERLHIHNNKCLTFFKSILWGVLFENGKNIK